MHDERGRLEQPEAIPGNARTVQRMTSAEVLRRVDPFLAEHIDPGEHEIIRLDPRSLLAPSRFDLGVKLLFLEDLAAGNLCHLDLYDEHIRLFSLGKYEEPGKSPKHNLDDYVSSFSLLHANMQERGFDETESLIPLDRNGRLLNGSHRVASAIALGLSEVPCVRTRAVAGTYDFRFFRERGASTALLDLSAGCIARWLPACRVALLWPASRIDEAVAHELIPDMYYQKEIQLSADGARNLVAEVYRGEAWIGSRETGFRGAEAKAVPCFDSERPLRVVLFVEADAAQVLRLKERIRERAGVGKHSIHIDDTHERSVEIAEVVFNSNTLHFLDRSRIARTTAIWDQVESLVSECRRVGVDRRKIIVDGSAVLAMYGLRDARDLDYLSTSPDAAGIRGFDAHAEVVEFHECSADTLIRDARRHFTHRTVRFVSLPQLRAMKLRRAEPKDLADCSLIAAARPPSPLAFAWKRAAASIRFTVSKHRALLERFERTPLYPLGRRLYRWLVR
jgi:hypothetical protein